MQIAQDDVRQIEPFTSQFGDFDVSSAYEVADLIHRARMQQGAVPVGRKIGFTNPDMWAIYGVQEPIWAYVYDTTVVQLGRELNTCSISRYTEPKIEPEIIFHFHTALPPGGDLASILACIDWVAHGFEIVQSHFPGWKFQAADTVAAWALHGTLLVGEPQSVGRLGPILSTKLERFSLDLSCDGMLREVGTGANVLGSPLLAIAHLISVLVKQPEYMPLQAGELVTTGTITTAQSGHVGARWGNMANRSARYSATRPLGGVHTMSARTQRLSPTRRLTSCPSVAGRCAIKPRSVG
jgi:2-oxo-3-hexenedioate decarboxylase